jgi:hypothetical protein
MNSEVFSLVVQVFILLLGVYLAFFKSYFSEKGKNLATQEDIEEITEKVESIKTEFVRETEKLKIELQFENQAKISFHNDVKQAVIQSYEGYYAWYNSLTHTQEFSVEFTRIDIKEAFIKFNKIYFKFISVEAKLDLYVNDENLKHQLDKLVLKTVDLEKAIEIDLTELELIINKEEKAKDLFTNGLMKRDEYLKVIDNRIVWYKACCKKTNAICEEVAPLLEKYRDSCYKILKNQISNSL